MNGKSVPVPTPPKNKPYKKSYLPDQGPKINGSSLQYSTSSGRMFKLPEARP